MLLTYYTKLDDCLVVEKTNNFMLGNEFWYLFVVYYTLFLIWIPFSSYQSVWIILAINIKLVKYFNLYKSSKLPFLFIKKYNNIYVYI